VQNIGNKASCGQSIDSQRVAAEVSPHERYTQVVEVRITVAAAVRCGEIAEDCIFLEMVRGRDGHKNLQEKQLAASNQQGADHQQQQAAQIKRAAK
jgi:hypothetical protein